MLDVKPMDEKLKTVRTDEEQKNEQKKSEFLNELKIIQFFIL